MVKLMQVHPEGSAMPVIQIHLVESMESQVKICDGKPYALPPIQLLQPVTLCMRCHIQAFNRMLKETKIDG